MCVNLHAVINSWWQRQSPSQPSLIERTQRNQHWFCFSPIPSPSLSVGNDLRLDTPATTRAPSTIDVAGTTNHRWAATVDVGVECELNTVLRTQTDLDNLRADCSKIKGSVNILCSTTDTIRDLEVSLRYPPKSKCSFHRPHTHTQPLDARQLLTRL